MDTFQHILCVKCQTSVGANKDVLLCKGCNLWQHRKCTDVPVEFYRQFYVQTMLKQDVEPWQCTYCTRYTAIMKQEEPSPIKQTAKADGHRISADATYYLPPEAPRPPRNYDSDDSDIMNISIDIARVDRDGLAQIRPSSPLSPRCDSSAAMSDTLTLNTLSSPDTSFGSLDSLLLAIETDYRSPSTSPIPPATTPAKSSKQTHQDAGSMMSQKSTNLYVNPVMSPKPTNQNVSPVMSPKPTSQNVSPVMSPKPTSQNVSPVMSPKPTSQNVSQVMSQKPTSQNVSQEMSPKTTYQKPCPVMSPKLTNQNASAVMSSGQINHKTTINTYQTNHVSHFKNSTVPNTTDSKKDSTITPNTVLTKSPVTPAMHSRQQFDPDTTVNYSQMSEQIPTPKTPSAWNTSTEDTNPVNTTIVINRVTSDSKQESTPQTMTCSDIYNFPSDDSDKDLLSINKKFRISYRKRQNLKGSKSITTLKIPSHAKQKTTNMSSGKTDKYRFGRKRAATSPPSTKYTTPNKQPKPIQVPPKKRVHFRSPITVSPQLSATALMSATQPTKGKLQTSPTPQLATSNEIPSSINTNQTTTEAQNQNLTRKRSKKPTKKPHQLSNQVNSSSGNQKVKASHASRSSSLAKSSTIKCNTGIKTSTNPNKHTNNKKSTTQVTPHGAKHKKHIYQPICEPITSPSDSSNKDSDLSSSTNSDSNRLQVKHISTNQPASHPVNKPMTWTSSSCDSSDTDGNRPPAKHIAKKFRVSHQVHKPMTWSSSSSDSSSDTDDNRPTANHIAKQIPASHPVHKPKTWSSSSSDSSSDTDDNRPTAKHIAKQILDSHPVHKPKTWTSSSSDSSTDTDDNRPQAKNIAQKVPASHPVRKPMTWTSSSSDSSTDTDDNRPTAKNIAKQIPASPPVNKPRTWSSSSSDSSTDTDDNRPTAKNIAKQIPATHPVHKLMTWTSSSSDSSDTDDNRPQAKHVATTLSKPISRSPSSNDILLDSDDNKPLVKPVGTKARVRRPVRKSASLTSAKLSDSQDEMSPVIPNAQKISINKPKQCPPVTTDYCSDSDSSSDCDSHVSLPALNKYTSVPSADMSFSSSKMDLSLNIERSIHTLETLSNSDNSTDSNDEDLDCTFPAVHSQSSPESDGELPTMLYRQKKGTISGERTTLTDSYGFKYHIKTKRGRQMLWQCVSETTECPATVLQMRGNRYTRSSASHNHMATSTQVRFPALSPPSSCQSSCLSPPPLIDCSFTPSTETTTYPDSPPTLDCMVNLDSHPNCQPQTISKRPTDHNKASEKTKLTHRRVPASHTVRNVKQRQNNASKAITLKQQKSNSGSQPIKLKQQKSNSGSQPITLKQQKSNSGSQPITLKQQKSNSGSQPITLKQQKSNSGSQPITLKQQKSNSRSHEIRAKQPKPSSTSQPITSKQQRPNSTSQPIRVEQQKSQSISLPITSKQQKTNITSQPIRTRPQNPNTANKPMHSKTHNKVIREPEQPKKKQRSPCNYMELDVSYNHFVKTKTVLVTNEGFFFEKKKTNGSEITWQCSEKGCDIFGIRWGSPPCPATLHFDAAQLGTSPMTEIPNDKQRPSNSRIPPEDDHRKYIIPYQGEPRVQGEHNHFPTPQLVAYAKFKMMVRWCVFKRKRRNFYRWFIKNEVLEQGIHFQDGDIEKMCLTSDDKYNLPHDHTLSMFVTRQANLCMKDRGIDSDW